MSVDERAVAEPQLAPDVLVVAPAPAVIALPGARTLANAASGFGAERLGYSAYFTFTFFLSFPAYLLLPWVRAWSEESGGRRGDD